MPGDDLKDLKPSGPSTVRPGERGPLVASLVIESDAPGCRKLRREVRAVAGLDYVELWDLVDKTRLEAKSYVSKAGKESVQFGFPFRVPGGQIVLDIPLGMMRPEVDQIPGASEFAAGGALRRRVEPRPRRYLGDVGRPDGRDRRHHRHAGEFADQSQRMSGEPSSPRRSFTPG